VGTRSHRGSVLVRCLISALSASLAMLIPPCVAGAAGPALCPERHWVGVWSASPSDTGPGLDHQTIRMMVTPHADGRRIRLRFTNRFGSDPLELTNVRIAKQAAGPAVIAGTGRPVSWHESKRVTIPPGGDIKSDPVALTFKAFEPLAISAYVPGPVGAPTRHLDAEQTSYLTSKGSGDHASDVGGAAFTSSLNSWLLLSGVDVSTQRRMGSVAAFGDSITDGTASGIDANARYPDFLARRLLGANRLGLSVVNAGIAGNSVLFQFFRQFGPSGLSRARADVINQPGVRGVILLEGINDLNIASASDLIGGLRRLVRRFRAAGLSVLLGTLTPLGAQGKLERRRLAVNRWILGRPSREVVDFARAVRAKTDPHRLAPAYDSGDHLHLSPAGNRAMAAAIPLSRLQGGGCR
jgi:lysophospholipase L1-like esterase